MALNLDYTWTVTSLDSYMTASGQTDVVFRARYNLLGVTGSHSASFAGATPITFKSGSVFIPFEELTNDIVVGWISSSLIPGTFEHMTGSIEKQISLKLNPIITNQTPPWMPQSSGSLDILNEQ